MRAEAEAGRATSPRRATRESTVCGTFPTGTQPRSRTAPPTRHPLTPPAPRSRDPPRGNAHSIHRERDQAAAREWPIQVAHTWPRIRRFRTVPNGRNGQATPPRSGRFAPCRTARHHPRMRLLIRRFWVQVPGGVPRKRRSAAVFGAGCGITSPGVAHTFGPYLGRPVARTWAHAFAPGPRPQTRGTRERVGKSPISTACRVANPGAVSARVTGPSGRSCLHTWQSIREPVNRTGTCESSAFTFLPTPADRADASSSPGSGR